MNFLKEIKLYIKDVFDTYAEGLSSESPVIHPVIMGILEDDAKREIYLKRVNEHKGNGVIDISDLL